MVDNSKKKERITKAMHCEMPDKTPLFGTEGQLLARLVAPEFVQGDCYTRPEWAMDRIIEGALEYDCDFTPLFDYACGNNFFTKDGCTYLMPGRDLPASEGVQVIEHNYMDKPEYYAYIIENGWDDFYEKYVESQKDMEQCEQDFYRQMELIGTFNEKVEAAGLDSYDLFGTMMGIDGGVYLLSMLRGYGNFLKDMRKYPEQVKEAIRIIDDAQIASNMAEFDEMQPPAIVGNLSRIDNGSLSHKMFEEFVWPTFGKMRDVADEHDVCLAIHADGDYANDVDLFTQFTPGRTIMQHDGFTDPDVLAPTYREHKICFWGDIPPQMMALGTPDEVYNRAMHLKELFGPGLILTAGCSYPPNTKMENFLALKRAADNMDF